MLNAVVLAKQGGCTALKLVVLASTLVRMDQ